MNRIFVAITVLFSSALLAAPHYAEETFEITASYRLSVGDDQEITVVIAGESQEDASIASSGYVPNSLSCMTSPRTCSLTFQPKVEVTDEVREAIGQASFEDAVFVTNHVSYRRWEGDGTVGPLVENYSSPRGFQEIAEALSMLSEARDEAKKFEVKDREDRVIFMCDLEDPNFPCKFPSLDLFF